MFQHGLQFRQSPFQQITIRILLLKDFVFIVDVTFALLLLVPVLKLILSVIFQNGRIIFLPIIIFLFFISVTIKSFIPVLILLSIFRFFAFIIIAISSTCLVFVCSICLVSISSIIPLVTSISVFILVIIMIHIVFIKSVKWFANLWLRTWIWMSWVVIFGWQLHLILEYL